MISELEQRLADVVGAALPAPFTGTVSVAPGPVPGVQPAIVLGTTTFDLMEDDFGSGSRPETVPPVADPRRVVRLRCGLAAEVRPGQGQGRAQQLAGLDALLYLLDGPDFQRGVALVDGTDQGFVLDRMRVVDGRGQTDPAVPGQSPVALNLEATGWFWPPGTTGAAGPAIVEVRLRGVDLPLATSIPLLVAGGTGAILTFTFGATGSLRAVGSAEDATPAPLPFGSLALRLVGRAGRPGAGTLSGGTPGAGGVLLVPVTNGEAAVEYTPPAEAVEETLVIAFDDGANGAGVDVARVPLRVTAEV